MFYLVGMSSLTEIVESTMSYPWGTVSLYLLVNKFQVRKKKKFLHLIIVGWAIFTAVFGIQLVQIFLYGQEKIALVDIRNIPVLLVLIGVSLIPITIHSF